MIEAVIAACIQDFAESMGLLSDAQMGAWQEPSTETVIVSLLAWIWAAWGSGGAVMSVLALDVSGAFDQMLKKQLVWALKQQGLP